MEVVLKNRVLGQIFEMFHDKNFWIIFFCNKLLIQFGTKVRFHFFQFGFRLSENFKISFFYFLFTWNFHSKAKKKKKKDKTQAYLCRQVLLHFKTSFVEIGQKLFEMTHLK